MQKSFSGKSPGSTAFGAETVYTRTVLRSALAVGPGLDRALGFMTSLAGNIASVLAPHLGAHSADAVARHICAKYAIEDEADREKLEKLRDFLRRGLVVYVGVEKAEEVAQRCIEASAEQILPTPSSGDRGRPAGVGDNES
jgi:hypothetical protein